MVWAWFVAGEAIRKVLGPLSAGGCVGVVKPSCGGLLVILELLSWLTWDCLMECCVAEVVAARWMEHHVLCVCAFELMGIVC